MALFIDSRKEPDENFIRPGFGLVRQEIDGRQIRYTTHSYATDKPAGQRY